MPNNSGTSLILYGFQDIIPNSGTIMPLRSDILIRPEKGLAHFGDFGGVDQTSW
jgi:hypothetical protein